MKPQYQSLFTEKNGSKQQHKNTQRKHKYKQSENNDQFDVTSDCLRKYVYYIRATYTVSILKRYRVRLSVRLSKRQRASCSKAVQRRAMRIVGCIHHAGRA